MPDHPPILLTNTMGHRLEEFKPLDEDVVLMYQCGPTVYNYAHIGNFRAFIFGDTLRRTLEYNGYRVDHVRNITDVGHLTNDTLGTGVDKIEQRAREQNMTPWDIARYFTEAFERDARSLNLEAPTHSPRATEYISQMIALVQRLIERGYAYESGGNVYFEVSRFPAYGKLSGNSVEDLIAGARVEVEEGKRSPGDFALWKAAEPDKIMKWPSPWGEGVPGWHLECSAMAIDLLGEAIDVHTGGEDHVFPHHEDEIAQSEAATGKTFARYWLHNAFLQVGEKMSKSLGNVYTLADVVERGFHPLAFRYYTYGAHYRTPQNFSWEGLEGAQAALRRLWEATADLIQSGPVEEAGKVAAGYRDRFHGALNRDLNTSSALDVTWDLVGSQLPPGQKLALLQDFDRVLALDLVAMGQRLSEISPEEEALLRRRAEARAARDWAASDQLRDELAGRGVEVRDTPVGQRWVRKDVLDAPSALAAQPT